MIANVPGTYKAIWVHKGGIACGPMRGVAYYVVPNDSRIEFISLVEKGESAL